MKQYLTKPYTLIWFSIIILLALKELMLHKDTLVLNVGDTYYVTEKRNYAILLSIVLLGISLIYLFLERLKIQLYSKLISFHLILTLIPLLIFPIIEWYFSNYYQANNFHLFDRYQYLENITLSLIFLVVIAQLLFISNISIGIYKYFKPKKY